MEHIDLMYLSLISNLIPISVVFFLFKKLPTTLKILSVYVVVSGVMDLTTFILFQNRMNNMILYHLHTAVEFFSISAIYFYIFRSKKALKYLVISASAVFSIVSLTSLFFWEGILEFNSIQRMVEFGILMVYFISFFSTIINTKRAPFLELHPYFILSMGLFIYFSGTLLVFLSANNFIKLGIVDFWMIHGLLNVFLNIIYAIVLWNGSRLAKHL